MKTFLLTSLHHFNQNLSLTPLNGSVSADEADSSSPEAPSSDLRPLQRVPPRNITLREVYPPHRGGDERPGFVHLAGPGRELRPSQPLPDHTRPVHYELRVSVGEGEQVTVNYKDRLLYIK